MEAVFAYLIHHVKINLLNDSKFMVVFIIMAIAVSIVGNLFDLLLYKYIGIITYASVWGIFFFTGAILLLSVLFIPKVPFIVTAFSLVDVVYAIMGVHK